MQNDIQINHLYFSYDGATVLEDINLSYNKNEFLAIIGPNGGGKSTLLKMMIGLLEPERGEVLLFGEKPLQVSYCVQAAKKTLAVYRSPRSFWGCHAARDGLV